VSRCKVEYRSTSKETFQKFKLKHPEVKISHMEWCNIIYSFNYAFRDLCLETGSRLKFPYGIGEFCITKYKPPKKKVLPDGSEYPGLPINWQKTKELGKVIYHMNFNTEGFKFRWLWFPASARFLQPHVWTFKPSRVSSRLVTHYIKEGYHTKYLSWK
jgi:hypothetical protein